MGITTSCAVRTSREAQRAPAGVFAWRTCLEQSPHTNQHIFLHPTHAHLIFLLLVLVLSILHFVEDAVEHLNPLLDLLQRAVDLRLQLAPVPHRGRLVVSQLTTAVPSKRRCFCFLRNAVSSFFEGAWGGLTVSVHRVGKQLDSVHRLLFEMHEIQQEGFLGEGGGRYSAAARGRVERMLSSSLQSRT
jgi:hypothetical protein